MKTAMQELIDDMTYMLTGGGERNICALREKARKLLEKEKEQIINANRDGVDMVVDKKDFTSGEQYYNKTFNTKEK